MSRTTLSTAVALVLFAAGDCHADSLAITYRSGKTQTVVLDEPSQAVVSWRFDSAVAPPNPDRTAPQKGRDPVQIERNSQITDERQVDKTPAKKSGLRLKLNAKPLPD